jgi:hypothetical protein
LISMACFDFLMSCVILEGRPVHPGARSKP